MNRFIRYWNQNRGKIIITIAIIAFIFIIIQLAGHFLRELENPDEEYEITDETKPTESVMTGTIISEEKTDINLNIINQFVDACNQKKYEEAYNILSESCKKEVYYNDINKFIENYAQKIFTVPKTYSIELWVNSVNSYTYQVKFYDNNLLATGGSNMNNNYEDYITIVKEDNKEKLNISSFIRKEEINKSQKENEIEIIINSINIYKTYQTYNVTINNYSSKNIMLNDGQDGDDICLIDDNEVRYPSILNEIPLNHLSLKSRYQKNIDIKFNMVYGVERKIDWMMFSNIILDEDLYKQGNQNVSKTDITVEI